jgi:hypothetical protein
VRHFSIARLKRRACTHAAWFRTPSTSQSADPERNGFVPAPVAPRVKRAKRSGDEARERPLWSARQRAGQEGREIFEHLLFEKRNLGYDVRIGGHKAAPIEGGRRRDGQGKEIFYLESL